MRAGGDDTLSPAAPAVKPPPRAPPVPDPPPRRALWRQDDHGNRVLIDVLPDRAAADARRAAFEARGHRQTYRVAPHAAADDLPPGALRG